MALRFTDLKGKTLFEFKLHEYPEKLPWNIEVSLNKIKYPDDHYTNQIIGAKLGEIEFSGKFEGTYFDGGKFITARERSDQLAALIKKVVVINYAVGGNAGWKSTVIIEEYKRDLINYYEVDYTLKLVPHEPQTRVKPDKAANITVASDGDDIGTIARKAVGSMSNAVNTANPTTNTANPTTANTPKGNQVRRKLTKDGGVIIRKVGKLGKEFLGVDFATKPIRTN